MRAPAEPENGVTPLMSSSETESPEADMRALRAVTIISIGLPDRVNGVSNSLDATATKHRLSYARTSLFPRVIELITPPSPPPGMTKPMNPTGELTTLFSTTRLKVDPSTLGLIMLLMSMKRLLLVILNHVSPSP